MKLSYQAAADILAVAKKNNLAALATAIVTSNTTPTFGDATSAADINYINVLAASTSALKLLDTLRNGSRIRITI